MNKVMITGTVISKGYENNPSLRFNEARDVVRFKIGYTVYDKRADKNRRWINLNVTAFKPLVDRIVKMELKEGSYINVFGRLDEDVWTTDDGITKRVPVIILEDIEFSGGGNGDKKSEATSTADPTGAPIQEIPGEPEPVFGNGVFEGFTPVGDGNSLY